MPPHHGVGSNDGERTAGSRKQVTDPTKDHSVADRKWQTARFATSEHDDLLSQHQHLASSAARGRTRSTTIPKIILQRSSIPQKIIRFCVSRQLDGIYDRPRGKLKINRTCFI